MFNGKFYEQKALQYIASRAPILVNVKIRNLEVDGILNNIPIEVKSYCLTKDMLEKIRKKFTFLGFEKGIVIAPSFEVDKFEGLELVKFFPDYNYIFEYYKKWRPKIPSFIKLKWRQIRIETPNGFIKIKDRITSLNKLKKKILSLKQAPIRVFYSQLRWLEPEKIGEKNFKDITLGSEFLVFDVDGDKLHHEHHMFKNGLCPTCIELAKKETIKLAESLKDVGFKRFFVVFSGRRGFHLYVLDVKKYFKEIIPQETLHREYWEQIARKRIADLLKEKGIKFDYQITVDTRRIIGLPSSLHGYTGLPLYLVGSIKKLEKFELQFPAKG